MSAQAVIKFIAIVEVFFPRPKFAGAADSETIWLRSMQDALKGYDESVLLEAARQIQLTRNPHKDGKFFPSIFEIKTICDEIAATRERAQMKLLADPKADEWSDERLALAFDLCKSEVGRRAAREGWVAGLYHHVRKHQRLPDPFEISKIKETAEWIDRAEWPGDGIGAAFQDWGRVFLERRQGLSEAILSGKAKFSYWGVQED